jgi:hypothetical protein
MVANGFSVVQHFQTATLSNGNIDDRFGANGPVAYNQCGDTTTWYLVDCVTSPSTKQVLYLAPAASLPGCAGGGS